MCGAAIADETFPVHVDLDAVPYKSLSEYHFFLGTGASQEPNEGVVPFDIGTPLFSDYAIKHRFLWLPDGTAARYDPEEAFHFPVGAVIIKTFSYLHDLRDPSKGENIIETRLLVHKPDGWVGFPYIWNEDKTDAVLKVAGGTRDVEWIHYDGSTRTNNYIIPNMNQCKSCHEQAGVLEPIGPKARNLNKPFVYDHGTENQLRYWSRIGYLNGAPADPDAAPRLPVWNDPSTGPLNARARAWLEVNCMHCHNPEGAGNTTGLDLRFSQSDPVKIGIMKPPVAAGRGSGGLHFDIVPGKPDKSILLYRLESTDPGVMMPELPRRLVDEEGVELIREWILELGEDSQVGD